MIARIFFAAAMTVFVASGCASKQPVQNDVAQDNVSRAEEAAKRAEEAAKRAEVSAEKSEVIFHKGLQK